MKLTFWGVRGSIATSGHEFARTGGNTTCLEVEAGDRRLIIDAGTGLRGLGQKLLTASQSTGRPIQATFLFTHLHWDHIQGFPFFTPAFLPTTELDLYGPRDGETSLKQVLGDQMKPPTFPIPLDAMASEKRFHAASSGDGLEVGPLYVQMRALCHPQGSLGFRIEAGGRKLCFATDTEHRATGDIDPSILELARDVDLLVLDAQYTEEEYRARIGWGHSTYVAAARIAKASGARRLALFHHDPMHGDDMIDRMEQDARTIFDNTFAAREGATIDV